MSSKPAPGAEIGGNAGRQQADADEQCSHAPCKLDTAALQKEVQQAKDQHQYSGFGQEGGTTARSDGDEFRQCRGDRTGFPGSDQPRPHDFVNLG